MKLPQIKDIRAKVLDLRRDVIFMMRLKFIAVAMAILVSVFLVMLTAINMIMNTVSQTQSMKLLRQIAESNRYDMIGHNDNMMPMDDNPPEAPNGSDPPPEEMPSDTAASDTASAELSDGGFLSLAWGRPWEGEEQEMNPPPYGMPRYPQPTEEDIDDDDDDILETEERRPWERREGEDFRRPTENVPPPWETEIPPSEAPAMTEAPPPPEQPAVETQPDPIEPPAEPEIIQPDPQTDPAPSESSSETESTAGSDAESTSESETTTGMTETTEAATSQTPPAPREPRMDRWNVPITIDHFAIMVSQDGAFLGIRNTENYTDEEAEEIMNGILAKEKSEGMYGWLQFCSAQKGYGTLLVITDKTSDQGILNNLFRTTVIIGTIMLLVLLAILIVLSHFITEPVQQAFKRQKQFVSDAGHELKTPIAVLTTNADILQDEIGENKWLVYMQEQIGRMNQLVGDLLRLARMDNATQEYNFADFDLSMAVAATTLPFESSAFEQHKSLEMDVQPGVHYRGSEQHIRQLCAIFIDNALKYSNDNGLIKVTLLQRGDHQILEFYNTGCEISQAETEKIFERFYRGDKARSSSKQSGYGLGLAIAKSIMDVHKIKFQVTCEQGKWIRFLLTL